VPTRVAITKTTLGVNVLKKRLVLHVGTVTRHIKAKGPRGTTIAKSAKSLRKNQLRSKIKGV